jgi:hypothetical protein
MKKHYGKIRKIKYKSSTRSLLGTFCQKEYIGIFGIINKLVKKDNKVCRYMK